MLRCAVIGVGYLGRFHAQKYLNIPQVQLVAVCDHDPNTSKRVAQELQVEAYHNFRDLFGRVDAVSIAATTNQHFAIAQACIEQGIHVLIEKPITETVEQADTLIALAEKHQVTLQVGHLERFNSARIAVEPYLDAPLFIESERVAPFNPRGTDVNVILDLMIHDIDIIQAIVHSPIKRIEAYGMPVLTSLIDVANARIVFKNGCIANVTASRVSAQTQRKTRIFQKNAYICLDYQNKKLELYKKSPYDMPQEESFMEKEEFSFPSQDALFEEIKSFIYAIEHRVPPLVTGAEGRDALSTASRITSLIHENLQVHHEAI